MPCSSDIFDKHVQAMLELLKPKQICDVGPGASKYGRMARALDTDAHETVVTAIEIDDSYFNEFKLNEIYDEIILGDVINIINEVRRRFDLVIFGDCIEHMRKSDGLDLINFL